MCPCFFLCIVSGRVGRGGGIPGTVDRRPDSSKGSLKKWMSLYLLRSLGLEALAYPDSTDNGDSML